MNEFNKYKAGLEALGNEMVDKNKRIYFDAIPDMKILPKVEKIIKVNPTQIPDDLSKGENTSALDALVPREVRGMIGAFKQQMMVFVSENLDKYENEGKVAQFLADLNLPFSLDTAVSTNEISDSLWKRISEVQQKGGSLYLTNHISNIERRSDEIMKRINDMELVLYVKLYSLITERRGRR